MSGRIYRNFSLAFSEIKRDLKEMGEQVKTKTVQGKDITNTDEYDTLELLGYQYQVSTPLISDLEVPNMEWAIADWEERLAGALGKPVNPGKAYLLRDERNGDSITWADHLNSNGLFDYTYSERFSRNNQFLKVIQALKKDIYTRQAYIIMHDINKDHDMIGGVGRFPCSIGWQLIFRKEKLNIIYNMRSCELTTHFQNDIYMSLKILHFIAEVIGVDTGFFMHNINSFHCYKRNLQGVF